MSTIHTSGLSSRGWQKTHLWGRPLHNNANSDLDFYQNSNRSCRHCFTKLKISQELIMLSINFYHHCNQKKILYNIAPINGQKCCPLAALGGCPLFRGSI